MLSLRPIPLLFVRLCIYRQVLGISHLSRDLKHCDEFIACGREAVPLEMQPDNCTPAPAPGRGPPAAGSPRRRAATPYHARAMQGVNANNTTYNRLKKGAKRPLKMMKMMHVCPPRVSLRAHRRALALHCMQRGDFTQLPWWYMGCCSWYRPYSQGRPRVDGHSAQSPPRCTKRHRPPNHPSRASVPILSVIRKKSWLQGCEMVEGGAMATTCRGAL